MARLRKFIAYRKLERPYTRVSKYREKSFVRARPHLKLVRFEMGDPKGKFDYELELVAKSSLQIRHDALESARQTCNRHLEKNLGKTGYFLKIMVYPFHILRENPLASGANADRTSTGMKNAFGRPIGAAAQIKSGQRIFLLRVNKDNIEIAKEALKKASKKLPCKYAIIINKVAKQDAKQGTNKATVVV